MSVPSNWMRRAARDARALSHYRPRQVLWRGILLARRRIAGWAPSIHFGDLARYRARPGPTRPRRPEEGFLAYALDPTVLPPQGADALLSGTFSFLGSPREFGVRPRWNDRGPGAPSHLWRMNLHYHRFLADAAAGARRDPRLAPQLLSRASFLLEDWWRECPPGARAGWSDAWNSYAVSTRLLNAWLAWLLTVDVTDAESRAFRSALEGLGASHARFLERWIEWDLGGNHLLRNAAALLAAGRWFSGDHADRWRRLGYRLLRRELDRQLLRDGFHEERSPMYHALLLEDLLLAARGPAPDRDEDSELLARHATAMRRALGSVVHPDGEIALFNDAAMGIAAAPGAIDRLATAVGIPGGGPPGDLPDAGYFRFAGGSSLLLFDAGPLGPDHLPAHAHCDALSFEWSWNGRRVVTDTGVDRYEAGAERDFQRSTAAHATPQVDDLEQAECFSSFRVGRRPRVSGSRLGPDEAEGSHDGFGAQARIRRRIRFLGPDEIEWTDRLEGTGTRRVTVRLPVSPDVVVRAGSGGAALKAPGAGELRLVTPEGGELAVETGSSCERFGSCVPRPVLRWRALVGAGRDLRFRLFRSGGAS